MNEIALATVLAVIGSTSDVRAIVADDETIWVGTTGGLFALASGEPRDAVAPLPPGTVHALLIEGDTLWVGTDSGVAAVDRATRRVSWTEPMPSPVRALALASDGTLLVGTWGSGLYHTHIEARGRPQPIVLEARGGAIDDITALGTTPRGLYVATASRGAFLLRHRRGRVLPALEDARLRTLRGGALCFSIATDGRDAWIACSDGLHHFRNGRRVRDGASRASRDLPIADLRAVMLRDGAPVVGTAGAGAFAWTDGGFHPVADRPSWLVHARVSALALDGDGRILAGTTAGLARPMGDGTFDRLLGGDLPDEDVTSLAQTGEGLWVGTFQHGLALVRDDGRIERFSEARGLVDDRINRLAVDRDGDLWIATDRGVMEREGGRFVLRGLLGEHVFMVACAGGRIWAAAGSSLVVRTSTGWSEVATLTGRRPQDVTTHAGAVQVATAEGLARRVGGRFALTQSERGGLVDDWITAVADYRGRLVAGTYNAGLMFADASDIEALRDDLWVNAGAIAVAGDVLAVGTLDQGLWLHDGASWRALTTADGLPDDDVTAILPLPDGSMWVATRGGLAYVGERHAFAR